MATHNVEAEDQAVEEDNYQHYGVNESEVPPPTNDDHYGAPPDAQAPAEELDEQPVDHYGAAPDGYGLPPPDAGYGDDANPYAEDAGDDEQRGSAQGDP